MRQSLYSKIMRIIPALSIVLIIFFAVSIEIMAAKESDYEQLFACIKKQQWPEVQRILQKIGHSPLQKIALSQRLQDLSYKKNSFEETAKFIQNNPSWPFINSIRLAAEGGINGSTDKQKIVDFFDKTKPNTPNGHKYYAYAAAEIVSNPASIIKKGWIYGNFSNAEEALYYKKFHKYLTEEDHVKKIDYFLSKSNITTAQKLLYYVNNGYKKSFTAQIGLIQKKQNSHQLFISVQEKYYTPGLIYEYLGSIKHQPPSSSEIIKLCNKIKDFSHKSEEFWPLQNYIIRQYIEEHKFLDAYNIASHHFATSASHLSEAEFMAGWLALRFLKKPDLAIDHFAKMKKIVKTPISVSRSLYWLGRAHANAGDSEKAKIYYQESATKYGYSFYGQLAGIEINQDNIIWPKAAILTQDQKQDNYAKNNELVRAMNIAVKYGSTGFARSYIDAVVRQSNEHQIKEVINNFSTHKNAVHYKAWLAKTAIQKHIFIPEYAYPTPYTLKDFPLKDALIYSIIRQESVFDQYAQSSANAMGLMQLISTTACEVSNLIKKKCEIHELTKNPKYNILLGSNYLNRLLEKFDGSYILAIAAYNGGKSGKWIELHGDVRTFTDIHKVIDWIEMIPYAETRNYVQRVLENVQVYQAIINKNKKNVLKDYLIPRNKTGANS